MQKKSTLTKVNPSKKVCPLNELEIGIGKMEDKSNSVDPRFLVKFRDDSMQILNNFLLFGFSIVSV